MSVCVCVLCIKAKAYEKVFDLLGAQYKLSESRAHTCTYVI